MEARARVLDADSWEVTIPVASGTSTVTLTALNHRGDVVGTDSVQVTNTSNVEPASAQNLVISEIHYHPAGDTAEEFIELQNIHASASIDLTGVAFTGSINFAFANGTIVAPGERVLIVQDLLAFSNKYGVGLPVAGVFANSTQLANSGEGIRLEAIGGAAIRDFAFDDNHPWPETPDGAGTSLVLIAPATLPDHSNPINWRASTDVGGNPATTDALVFSGDPNADLDGDGLEDFMNHALGVGASVPGIRVADDGNIEFEYARNLAADDVDLLIEVSTNLIDWNPAAGILSFLSESLPIDGVETVVYRSSASVGVGSAPLFIRLRAVER